jgi:release factor glutamine methyltransferase
MAPFRHLELAVGPGVFVPRPETELLAGWGIELLPSLKTAEPGVPGTPTRVADLCAGSGAIALAMVTELPGVQVYAVEREAAALEWLRRNTAQCPSLADSRVDVVVGDATAPETLTQLDGTVDLVLSNPPYVARDEYVADEARRFDPPSALWADEAGLSVIAAVVLRAAGLLRPGGWFGVEHGESHGEQVRALLRSDMWRSPVTHPDLTGRDRFTTAQRV